MSTFFIKQHNIYKAVVIGLLLFATNVFAQLDSEHYLPPLKQVSNNQAIQQQAIYFSTPVTTAFPIEIYRGNGTTPILTIAGLQKGAPKIFDSSSTFSLANGDNNITLVTDANTGIVLSDAGLRIIAPGGEKFYVNYRGRSGAQAGSLTSKGSKAKGVNFRWGGIPNRANNANLTTSLGMMATEDGTVVQVYGYDTGCEFRLGNNRGGITADTQTITLNKGQTFVLEASPNETAANVDGWLGATLTSNKPIVISNGGLNVGIRAGSQSRDVGIDQPVGLNALGREYVFVRGNGADESEFPIIVGTANGTIVYAGGVEIGTINDGDYLEIPGSYYSTSSAGGSMFVTTSKDAYAYQCLTGKANAIQTIGMNFIAPVNCLLPSLMDEISSINEIAGLNVYNNNNGNSVITIIASTTTPNGNIVVRQNGVSVPIPAPQFPAGTTDWKTFFVEGLEGQIDITSTGNIAVGTFLTDGNNAGLAGYFSGFDTIPVVEVEITGGGCFPSSDLIEKTGSFDAYQWYLDGNIIAGATSQSLTPASLGDYYVLVTKGTCSYASAVVAVYNCDPDIVLKKTADKNNLTDEETVTFTVQVKSSGLNPVSGLVINDAFPSQLDIVSVTPSVGSWSSPDWTIGAMNSGQIFNMKIVAKVPQKPSEGTFTNTISNTQNEIDSNHTLDDLVENVTITAKKIDLSLIKTVDKPVVKVGDVVVFTLTLKNTGPQSATGVQVKDILPTGLTYNLGASTIPNNTTYNSSTGIWDISNKTISNGETIVLKIAATVNTTNFKLNTTEVFNTEQKDTDSTPNSSN